MIENNIITMFTHDLIIGALLVVGTALILGILCGISLVLHWCDIDKIHMSEESQGKHTIANLTLYFLLCTSYGFLAFQVFQCIKL